jgi:hypothetical protein
VPRSGALLSCAIRLPSGSPSRVMSHPSTFRSTDVLPSSSSVSGDIICSGFSIGWPLHVSDSTSSLCTVGRWSLWSMLTVVEFHTIDVHCGTIHCSRCSLWSLLTVVDAHYGRCSQRSMRTAVDARSGRCPPWSMLAVVDAHSGRC